MAKKTIHAHALKAGFLYGLASSGQFVSRVLSQDAKAVRERSTYRGEGLKGDLKAVGRDMRKSAKMTLADR